MKSTNVEPEDIVILVLNFAVCFVYLDDFAFYNDYQSLRLNGYIKIFFEFNWEELEESLLVLLRGGFSVNERGEKRSSPFWKLNKNH